MSSESHLLYLCLLTCYCSLNFSHMYTHNDKKCINVLVLFLNFDLCPLREPISGFTPLMEAAASGHEIIVQYLLNHASVNFILCQ